MSFIRVFLALAPLILVATGQSFNETSLIRPHEYVVELKFYLRQEKLSEIIVDMVNSTETRIPVADIIELSGLKNYNLNETIQLLSYYNLTLSQVFTVDTLEETLRFAGVSFTNFYDALTKNVDVKGPILRDTIRNLNVNTGQFFEALGLNSDDVFDILRNGSYTQENIQNALNVSGRTQDEVFEVARDIIATEIVKLNKTYFMSYLNEVGMKQRQLLRFWTALNIQPANVYQVETFRNILQEILSNFHEVPAIAVATGSDTAVIHGKLYENFNDIDYGKFRIHASNLEVSGYRQYIAPNIVELRLKDSTENFVEVSTNPGKNCTYVTLINGSFVGENVTLQTEPNDYVAITKSNVTVFNLGSPLICENRLYALARSSNDTAIQFDTFSKELVTEAGLSAGAVRNWSNLVLGVLLLCLVF